MWILPYCWDQSILYLTPSGVFGFACMKLCSQKTPLQLLHLKAIYRCPPSDWTLPLFDRMVETNNWNKYYYWITSTVALKNELWDVAHASSILYWSSPSFLFEDVWQDHWWQEQSNGYQFASNNEFFRFWPWLHMPDIIPFQKLRTEFIVQEPNQLIYSINITCLVALQREAWRNEIHYIFLELWEPVLSDWYWIRPHQLLKTILELILVFGCNYFKIRTCYKHSILNLLRSFYKEYYWQVHY